MLRLHGGLYEPVKIDLSSERLGRRFSEEAVTHSPDVHDKSIGAGGIELAT